MSTEKGSARIEKSRKFRVLAWILASIVGIVLLVFFAIPLFLSSSGGTRLLLGKINASVDGQVQMEDLSVGWFRGIKLTNLLYTDDAGQTSVQVESVQTHPKYASLLGGKVKLGKTVIQSPHVDLTVPPDVSAEKDDAETPKQTKPFALPIHQMDLELRDGRVTIATTGQTPQKVSFTNIASNVVLAEAGQTSTVEVSMDVDESSKISGGGKITLPKKGWSLKDGDFDITVSKLNLASLKPLFALAGQGQMDMAGELNADATVRISENAVQQIKADAAITGFAQGSGEQRILFDQPVTLTARIAGTGPQMKIETLKVDSQFCDVDCTGSMESLDYRIDTDLGQTLRVAKQFATLGDVTVGGTLTASGNLKMTDATLAVNGKGGLNQLALQKADLKTAPLDAAMEYKVNYDKAGQLLTVDAANMTSASLGTVRIQKLRLPLGPDKTAPIALNADAELDLDKTVTLAKVFVPALADKQISGRLKAAATIESQGSQIHFTTQQTSIDQLKIAGKEGEPFVQERVTLDSDIRVDTEAKTIDVRTLDLQGARGETLIKVTKGKVEKSVSQKQTELKGNFEAEYDWKTVSSLAPVPHLVVNGKRKDAFHFESRYPTDKPDQMVSNLNASAKVGFDSASYNGLNVGPSELNMMVQKGIMDVTIPRTTVNEGTMEFAGTIDLNETPRFIRLKQPQPLLDKIQVNDTLTRNLLLYTNPIFADAVKTSGIASFSCQKLEIPLSKEDLDKMSVVGTFGIDSMRLQAGDFLGQILTLMGVGNTAMLTIHPTDFMVDKGYLSYQDMQLDIGSTPLHFQGKIGLDKTMQMEVGIPISGNTVLLPIEGTLNHPKINPGKLLERQGQELIREQIQKGFEGLFK